jgi:predicted phage terminase large subunit-like protein
MDLAPMSRVSLSLPEYEFVLSHDLMSFIERSFYDLNPQTSFSPSPHIEVMAARLEACRRGEIKRFIVNQPPRSLKSLAVSVAYPAWILGHNPTAQIICASYGQDLADKHARDCRTLMSSSFYQRLFPRTRLSTEKQSVNEFMTTANGFRMSTSVGGVLTGRGADLIILDDPLKPDDAMSQTRRHSVNEWYDNTLVSRLNSKETGTIILVMQRLHQDDLVGHVLEQEDWEVSSFPAIAPEDEVHLIESPFGRRRFERRGGEVLQPDRESLSTLKALRQTIGEYNFASQYQQDPMPLGGAIVKTEWLSYYEPKDLPSRFSCILQSWDTANKGGELNDFSVCTTWGATFDWFYLLSVFRRRLNYPDLKRAVLEQARVHHSDIVLIEDKASGTQLIQDLRAEGIFGIVPFDPPPGSDKVLRLHSQSAEFESGRVLLPHSAPWLEEYVRELTTFPGSKFDDQVDSTTQALVHLKANRSLVVWARL